ncbi:MAG: primosomal protein N' [Acidobacteria bacterium]|nr:primosomal protein N' [Acidobacteriota bacterium]
MHKPAAEISQIPEFVEVALPIPLRQTFTYRLPESLAERVRLGARLIVPFKTRQLTGYAVALHTSLDPELAIDPKLIKNVAEIVDDEPLINEEILKLTQWTADYYASSWGEVLRASLPAGINSNVEETVVITESGRAEESKFEVPKTNKQQILRELAANGETGRKYFEKHLGKSTAMRTLRDLANLGLVSLQRKQVRAAVSKKTRLAVRLTDTDSSGKKISESQQRILDLLATRGEMFQTELVEAAKVNQSPVSTLAKNGLVEIFEKEMLRDPFRDSSVPAFVPIKLTDRQASVLESINQAQKSERYKAFLLHGVTGSGKTEIYIRAMNFARDNGKSALMLVPEIALTPVFSKRLRAVFGDDVAILHSNLSSGERFDEWRRIRRGDARIVIGTRSAVFAPLANIGLLIVDEEHDGSYRQNEAPYYNGRDVAVVRASFANAVVVLGSATPALETFRNSEIGKYEYLSLPKRIGNRPMAAAEIVDMRNVFRTAGKDLSFSAELIEAIEETHSKGEQSIILLNRRGFSQFVLCRSCGESMRCRNCDITLTYHRRDVKLICHYCNHREKVPQTCPEMREQVSLLYGRGHRTDRRSTEAPVFTLADHARRPRHDGPAPGYGIHPGRVQPRVDRYARRHADARQRPRFSQRDACRRDLGRCRTRDARLPFGRADVPVIDAGRRPGRSRRTSGPCDHPDLLSRSLHTAPRAFTGLWQFLCPGSRIPAPARLSAVRLARRDNDQASELRVCIRQCPDIEGMPRRQQPRQCLSDSGPRAGAAFSFEERVPAADPRQGG